MADLDLIKKRRPSWADKRDSDYPAPGAESERDACKEEASRSSKHAERMTGGIGRAERRASCRSCGNQQSRSDALKAAAASAQASDAKTTAEAAAKRAENQRRSFEKQLAYARAEVENARFREEEQRERVAELG